MMRMRSAIAVMAVMIFACAPLARGAGQLSPAGLWQAVDSDTKEPTGWFLIAEHNGIYDGIIARMFLKPGEDPNTVCDKCKDDRKDHTWLGLEIIRGMKPEGEAKYGDGTILDPRDGKIYKATMKVTPDGQTLIVRGYLGFELLGNNQYWTRLPPTACSTRRLIPMRRPIKSPRPMKNAHRRRPQRPVSPIPHRHCAARCGSNLVKAVSANRSARFHAACP